MSLTIYFSYQTPLSEINKGKKKVVQTDRGCVWIELKINQVGKNFLRAALATWEPKKYFGRFKCDFFILHTPQNFTKNINLTAIISSFVIGKKKKRNHDHI